MAGPFARDVRFVVVEVRKILATYEADAPQE